MSATHIRVGFKLPREVVAQWDEWAKMLGISRTSLVVTAAAIGGKSLERSINPEKFVTGDLLRALDESGILDLSGQKYVGDVLAADWNLKNVKTEE